VRMAVGADHGGELGDLAALGQGKANQPRNNEEVYGKEFEEGGEDGTATRIGFVLGAERALYDVLVGAPIPETYHRRTEKHSEPWEVVVEIPGFSDDRARGIGLQHRGPGALHAGRNHRLPQVEHLGSAPG